VDKPVTRDDEAGRKPVLFQKTIKNEVTIEGIGLHTGRDAKVVISPAPADTGVVFIADGIRIKASCENVSDTAYATSIEDDGVSIRTIEHLLAALAGLSVDNAYIEVTGGEIPIMDGSAAPFVSALKETGLATLGVGRRFLKIVKPVTVQDGDKSATLLPASESRITYRIDFNHPLISDQSLSMALDAQGFEAELSSARTFGFLRDVEMLQKAGLAKGGSLNNAVVVDDTRILNEEGLRFKDEFVRHKMMDAVGDLSLLGMPFIGHLVADKSGHRLNHRLVCEVLSQRDAWIVVEGGTAQEAASAGLVLTEAV